MAHEIGFRPQARRDVVELATYIGRDRVEASNHFLVASARTFDFLATSPEIGTVYSTKKPTVDRSSRVSSESVS